MLKTAIIKSNVTARLLDALNSLLAVNQSGLLTFRSAAMWTMFEPNVEWYQFVNKCSNDAVGDGK